MATKEFNATTKELVQLLKKLSGEVPESSNASAYSKYLQKALTNAYTFDKTSPNYADYVARGLKPKKSQQSVAKTTTAPSAKQDDEKPTKKRATTTVDAVDKEKPVKKVKKAEK
jgi:hypothetical protein